MEIYFIRKINVSQFEMGIQFEQVEIGSEQQNEAKESKNDRGGGKRNKKEEKNDVKSGSGSEPRSASQTISNWLSDVEKFGLNFNVNVDEDGRESDNQKQSKRRWPLPTFCVCDPFSSQKIHNDENRIEILPEEGSSAVVSDRLVGYQVVRVFRPGDGEFILSGRWRNGLREGRGAICGPGLEKNYGVRDIVGGYRAGCLQGCAYIILVDGTTMSGNFVNGCLNGPCHGMKDSETMAFACSFEHGYPAGPCWRREEGKGYIYGHLNYLGRFTGDDIVYLFPDLQTCLRGRFKDGKMITAKECSVKSARNPSPSSILTVEFTEPKGPFYLFWPSTLDKVVCPPLQEDPYEKKHVEVRQSGIPGGGDGLYARVFLPEGAAVAFYNGIRVRPGQTPPFRTHDYEIYVDWSSNPVMCRFQGAYQQLRACIIYLFSMLFSSRMRHCSMKPLFNCTW